MANTLSKDAVAGSGANSYALILSGGQASRMGGVDKGLQVDSQGIALIDHQLAAFRLWPCIPLVSANRNVVAYQARGEPVLPDLQDIATDRPAFAGPMAGIVAAIHWIQALNSPAQADDVLLWWAVDSFLQLDSEEKFDATAQARIQARLCDLVKESHSNSTPSRAMIQCQAQDHPTLAAIHRSEWGALCEAYAQGERSPMRFLNHANRPAQRLVLNAPWRVRNMNSLQDLESS